MSRGRAAGARGARLKDALDSVAAQRILESYFASFAGNRRPSSVEL
jgi:RNase H-fold protein (predicted Holliday junction resolvase)